MKSNILIIILLSFVLLGCKTSEKPNLDYFDATFLDENNSKNSSNWQGVYSGTFPCKDCRGIDVEITINKDLSFTKKTKHIGKNDEQTIQKGKFSWDELGNSIFINEISYIVGKDMLVQHTDDQNLKTKDGLELSKNVLHKNTIDYNLTNSKWKLIELIGKTIKNKNTNIPYFTFNDLEKTFNGHSGCNNFLGTYRLYTSNRIVFSKIVTTQDFCFNAPFEGPLLRSLETVDNYLIQNDTLSFYKSNSTPIIQFICE